MATLTLALCSMSPWLRSQKTFSRLGFIIRNELYNAYGAINDDPVQLTLVSPTPTHKAGNWQAGLFLTMI